MAILEEVLLKRDTVFGEKEIPCYKTDNYGSIPQIVYKYFDLSIPHNLKSLIDNYVWFSNPSAFNDPFDCKIAYAYHLLAENENHCKKYFTAISLEKEPDLTPEQREIVVNINVDKLIKNKGNLDYFREMEKSSVEFESEMRDNIGMLCTCLVNDNILLWSHYTNSHTGICIGLKVDKLLDKYFSENMSAGLVRYGDFPLIMPPIYNSEDINASFEPRFYNKADFWNYELEYRFTELFCNERRKDITNMIDSIYMGYGISNENENIIKENCRKHGEGIKLFKAERAFFTYAIEFKEVTY